MTQQNIVDEVLTDLFEVGYIEYHPTEAPLDPELIKAQWDGWEAYIKGFLRRPAYCHTYLQIRDTFDTRFVEYMDKIANERRPATTASSSAPIAVNPANSNSVAGPIADRQ